MMMKKRTAVYPMNHPKKIAELKLASDDELDENVARITEIDSIATKLRELKKEVDELKNLR